MVAIGGTFRRDFSSLDGTYRHIQGGKAPGGTFRRDFSSLEVEGRLRAPSNYIFPVKHSRLEGAEQSQRAPSAHKGGMAQCPPCLRPWSNVPELEILGSTVSFISSPGIMPIVFCNVTHKIQQNLRSVIKSRVYSCECD